MDFFTTTKIGVYLLGGLLTGLFLVISWGIKRGADYLRSLDLKRYQEMILTFVEKEAMHQKEEIKADIKKAMEDGKVSNKEIERIKKNVKDNAMKAVQRFLKKMPGFVEAAFNEWDFISGAIEDAVDKIKIRDKAVGRNGSFNEDPTGLSKNTPAIHEDGGFTTVNPPAVPLDEKRG